MSKHTPGPWTYFPNRVDGRRGFDVIAPTDNVAEFMTQADARLIAAAPTLLDACKLAHAKLTAMFLASGHYALAPTLQALGDAIEQATKE